MWDLEVPLAGPGYIGMAGQDLLLHIVRAPYGDAAVQYHRSADQGSTFSVFPGIATGALYLEDPLIADGANLFLVYFKDLVNRVDWWGNRPCGNPYMKISRDRGLSWGTETPLSAAQGGFRQSLSVSGSMVHLVWMDYRAGRWDIYYRRSTTAGITWDPERLLVTGTPILGAERPQIVAQGNSVHVVWMDGRDNRPSCSIEGGLVLPQCTELYYKRSIDGGVTWGPDTRLTNDVGYSGRPDITMIGANVVVVTYDKGTPTGNEIQALRSINNGVSWGALPPITASPGESTHSSVFGLSPNLLHVDWMDRKAGPEYKIYYRRSIQGGNSWTPEEQVSFSGDAGAPLIALTRDYVHALWSTGALVATRRQALPTIPPEAPISLKVISASFTPGG